MKIIYPLVRFLLRYLSPSEIEILYFRQKHANEMEQDKRFAKLRESAKREMDLWLSSKGDKYKDEIYALKLSRPVPLGYSGITPPEISWEEFWGEKKNNK